jgi:hypothetical protein
MSVTFITGYQKPRRSPHPQRGYTLAVGVFWGVYITTTQIILCPVINDLALAKSFRSSLCDITKLLRYAKRDKFALLKCHSPFEKGARQLYKIYTLALSSLSFFVILTEREILLD